MSFTVANHVGRLIEVRVVPPLSLDEATRFMQEVVRLTSLHQGKIVACTDLRTGMRTVDPDTIDLLAGIMRSENPRLERNALIVSPMSATFALQMERMDKTAAAPQRRIFRTRGEAEAWRGEVSSGAQRGRLRAFLDDRK